MGRCVKNTAAVEECPVFKDSAGTVLTNNLSGCAKCWYIGKDWTNHT